MGFSRYHNLLRCIRLNITNKTYVSRLYSENAIKESLEIPKQETCHRETILSARSTLHNDDIVKDVTQKIRNYDEPLAEHLNNVPRSDNSIQVSKIEFQKSDQIVIDNEVLERQLLENDSRDLHDEIDDIKPPDPLEPCDEDLSYLQPQEIGSMNLAKFANKCKTLNELIKLGVQLYKIERRPGIPEMLLRVNYEKSIKPYIQFLHDCGVPAHMLGRFITKNPYIFEIDMGNLHNRIRYLRKYGFSTDMISRIVSVNPQWLSFDIKRIDFRLGFFQHTFKLRNEEVHDLSTRAPKVITFKLSRLKQNTFLVKEEMGFDVLDMKKILLKAPKVWIKGSRELMNSFEYIYDKMKITHEQILAEPRILLMRKNKLQARHEFLVELKKVQYDPTKPLYISPYEATRGTDTDFCANIAKMDVQLYNDFLKTL